MSFQVFAASDDTPVVLASDELVKYGRGCFARTGSSAEADIILHSENSDRFQDSFKLESREGKLFISGSNPRSVLYGVYSYLKHFGFAFPYPGEEGEVIPENPQFSVDGFHIAETASYPFRGLAFSPACLPEDSAESRDIAMRHAFDLLSWMAKNQYNLFFKEGFDEERPGDQYSVVNGEHPLQHVEYALQGRSWEERRAVALWQKRVVEEARRYGFLIERGGHGWNYGVPEHYALNHHISGEEAKARLKAKGKINRQAEAPVSTWFQLCLGEEEVREIYAEHILDYLAGHRGEMDIAAIWMGDGYDNKCQCEKCLRQPFSDLYLDIFRRVALKAGKIMPELTLEAIVYFESLEPPTRNWLEGLDNVILNFAVWGQCYYHKLDDPACRIPGWIPDYRNNRTHDTEHGKRLINYDQYLPYAKWRKIIGNDVKCLIFNYITYTKKIEPHFLSYDLTPLFVNSLEDFERLHFHGMVDCQVHSSWDKPSNLQLYGAGRILWNRHDGNPETIRKELFQLLYQEKAEAVSDYCREMYELLFSCGDYHACVLSTRQKKHLYNGLKKMEEKLQRLGELPKHREMYFRESIDQLIKQAT